MFFLLVPNPPLGSAVLEVQEMSLDHLSKLLRVKLILFSFHKFNEPQHEISTMWYVRPEKAQTSLRICAI